MSDPIKLDCCGITELAFIKEDESALESVMNIEPNDQAIVMFSDIGSTRYRYGKRLHALIGKEKLGIVIAIPVVTNPNTSHRVKMWVWTLNRRSLKAFQKRVRAEDPDTYGTYGYNEDPYYNTYNDGNRW